MIAGLQTTIEETRNALGEVAGDLHQLWAGAHAARDAATGKAPSLHAGIDGLYVRAQAAYRDGAMRSKLESARAILSLTRIFEAIAAAMTAIDQQVVITQARESWLFRPSVAVDLIARLRAHGMSLSAGPDGHLLINPRGLLSHQQAQELRRHHAEVLRELADSEAVEPGA